MAGADGSDRDVPGSDAIEPRSRLGPGDLAPDEERLLAALERDARGLREIPVKDTIPLVKGAVVGVRPPARGGPADDGLTPLFAAPELDD